MVSLPAADSRRDLTLLALWMVSSVVPAGLVVADDSASSCFDVAAGFEAPLREPIPLGEGGDVSIHGRRPDGIDWAATRAIVDLPAGRVLASLRDHRNVKDMSRTVLQARRQEQPGYLEVCHLDIDVTVRAIFLKLHVRWTEEWAYRLLRGSAERPEVALVNYQKIAGTKHIRHQCGSYLIRSLGDSRTDLFMYEEISARRRSSKDTSDMHCGILRNIREGIWPLESGGALPVLHVPAATR